MTYPITDEEDNPLLDEADNFILDESEETVIEVLPNRKLGQGGRRLVNEN